MATRGFGIPRLPKRVGRLDDNPAGAPRPLRAVMATARAIAGLLSHSRAADPRDLQPAGSPLQASQVDLADLAARVNTARATVAAADNALREALSPYRPRPPPQHPPPIRPTLAGWADALERAGLVKLATYRGKDSITTLLPRLAADKCRAGHHLLRSWVRVPGVLSQRVRTSRPALPVGSRSRPGRRGETRQHDTRVPRRSANCPDRGLPGSRWTSARRPAA
jgi:hypothetical protein